ncbi:MAG TPA: hypothetical protein VK509_14380, partial [Polyangiales bacterium]|nr:hypothetical protein [Polyangiales bacterium]
WAVGSAPMLVAYEQRMPVERALPEYAAALRADGRRVKLGAPEPDGARWLIAQRGSAVHAVIASPRTSGSMLAVTALQ